MSPTDNQGPVRLLAKHVLAHDGTDHRLLTDGEVVVTDDRVTWVGPQRSGDQVEAAQETIDLGDELLLPGFIDLDALCDIDHAILDSWHDPEHATLLQWSRSYAERGPRHVFTADDRAFIRRYAMIQLLLHGVTTATPIASEVHSAWAEGFDDAVTMATAAEELGLRLFTGPSYRSGVPARDTDGVVRMQWEPERGRQGLEDAIRFILWTRDRDNRLVTGVLLPCQIETLTTDVMIRTGQAARDLDTVVRLHCLQGLTELRLLAEEHAATPVELLRRTGLLNRDLLIPHAIYTDANPVFGDRPGGGSLAELAAAGVTVVHCPLTSARYAGGALYTFDSYRAAGIRLAIGTDSFPPDILRGIDTGMAVAKVLTGRTDAAAHADYVRVATLGGAAALRRDDLGRIAPGAQAGMISIRLDDLRTGVIDDPIRTAIQHASGRAVDLSMIAGRVVVRDGKIPGVDETALRRRAQALFAQMRSAYAQRTEPATPAELRPLADHNRRRPPIQRALRRKDRP